MGINPENRCSDASRSPPPLCAVEWRAAGIACHTGACRLFTYYIMLSSTGALCALIGLTASLFCLPGEGRLRKELHINKEEEM